MKMVPSCYHSNLFASSFFGQTSSAALLLVAAAQPHLLGHHLRLGDAARPTRYGWGAATNSSTADGTLLQNTPQECSVNDVSQESSQVYTSTV